ncbi:hypothetical protein AKJ16_DCAP21757 [Drosera capensis]
MQIMYIVGRILSRVDNTTILSSCSAAASPLLHSPPPGPPPQLSRPRLCLNPDQDSDTSSLGLSLVNNYLLSRHVTFIL